MHDLTGKVALIIGMGSSPSDSQTSPPIGAAIAILLARQGALVFGGNRSLPSASHTQSLIRSEGGECSVHAPVDATSSSSVKDLVSACLEKYGRIDILVPNVGRSEAGCPATLSEETWAAQMEVNLNTVYHAAHHVLPIMEKQKTGGNVVCISSVAGLRYIGKPQVGYNTAKAAIHQFVKATAVVYADKGVRLNAVVPGLVDTPYTKQLAERFPVDGGYEAFRKMRDGQVPMGRMGNAWDVANAVLFLASDEARYITGQKIVVDGGLTSSTGRT